MVGNFKGETAYCGAVRLIKHTRAGNATIDKYPFAYER